MKENFTFVCFPLFVNALTSAVVTGQVPINTIFFLSIQQRGVYLSVSRHRGVLLETHPEKGYTFLCVAPVQLPAQLPSPWGSSMCNQLAAASRPRVWFSHLAPNNTDLRIHTPLPKSIKTVSDRDSVEDRPQCATLSTQEHSVNEATWMS